MVSTGWSRIEDIYREIKWIKTINVKINFKKMGSF